MPRSTPPQPYPYLTRTEAMGRLGYRCLDTWYDHVNQGLIAGCEFRGAGRGRRIFYRAADLRFAGPISTIAPAVQRRDVERLARADAARPAGGFRNPFLKTRAAAAPCNPPPVR